MAGGFGVAESRCAADLSEAHELDVAVSAWIMEQSGFAVRARRALHLDRDYVRSGAVDPMLLFAEIEVPPVDFSEDLATLRGSATGAQPDVEVGDHCARPRVCEFVRHCSPEPAPTSVERLPRGGRLLMELRARGIENVGDIPPDTRMNPSQQHAAWSLRTGREYIGQGLLPALRSAAFPIRFMDFEATQPPVPRWPGARPFEQMPTQWSIHRLDADGAVSHSEFLHGFDEDPRPDFVRTLVAAAGSEGTIVVYGGFEGSVLRVLREIYPEAWSDLDGISDRLLDLFPIIRDHYYHPKLDGRFSVKSLAPVLCPEVDYGAGAVQDGYGASLAWLRMVSAETTEEDRGRIARELREYCGRDTLAMLRIRERLLERSAAN
jgi:hypothetical protein